MAPVIAVHLAWWLNAAGAHLPDCNPYLSGCLSVSAAARSGPGLHLFRAMALPGAALLALSWWLLLPWARWVGQGVDRGATVRSAVGTIGALFLILYAAWLGTEGDFYRWLRHQGVVFFFGLTALAQLMVAGAVWPRREVLAQARAGPVLQMLLVAVVLQWFLGFLSAFKDAYVAEPAAADAVGNILEWVFLWTLTLAQIAIALLVERSGFRLLPASARAESR